TVPRSRLAGDGPFWQWGAILQPVFRAESRFWTVGEHGSSAFLTSRLDLTCRGASTGDEGTTCTAFDGARTGFFAVDPATRRSTVLASVPGSFYFRTDAGRGWIIGWWERGTVLLHPATRRAIRVVDGYGRHVTDLAINGNTVGAASWNEHGSTI